MNRGNTQKKYKIFVQNNNMNNHKNMRENI